MIGTDERNRLEGLGPDAFAAPYAPHSSVFPRAAVNVHQGGVGTTAQALRAGRPMLVVPWSHDQFDNAERVKRLGVGGVLYRRRYKAQHVARALRRLLEDETVARRAHGVGERVRGEDGVKAACDAIEARINKGRRV